MRTPRHSFMAAASAAALISTSPAGAQITLVPRIDSETESQITLSPLHDFEAEVSLSIKTDPRLVPNERLLELVREIDMRDGMGIRITGGWDIDTQSNTVIAYSGGTAEITKARQTPQGLVVTALFKDHLGRIVTPPLGSIAAYTIDGERICFEVATIEDAPEEVPMSFFILLDVSGSMGPVIDDGLPPEKWSSLR